MGQSNKNNNRTNNNEPLTAPLRYGGERGNINSCAFNKHCAGRQFSASNPPQRKAAKRYMIPLSYTNRTKNPAKKYVHISK